MRGMRVRKGFSRERLRSIRAMRGVSYGIGALPFCYVTKRESAPEMVFRCGESPNASAGVGRFPVAPRIMGGVNARAALRYLIQPCA